MKKRYITYKCSVCKRSIDLLRDNSRVRPNYCVITKGCSGALSAVGEADIAEILPDKSDATLVDWYPRGTSPTLSTVDPDPSFTISTSPTGIISIALKEVEPTRESFILKVLERKVESIPYVQFIFRLLSPSTTVSGRDSQNRNLRFDQTAIDEDRIVVRVNGVERTTAAAQVELTPNLVTFTSPLSAGDTVDVYVYADKESVEKNITFAVNSEVEITNNTGAWANIRYVEDVSQGSSAVNLWWCYTSTNAQTISRSSRIKVVGLYEIDGVTPIPGDFIFLLASSPYYGVDRYLNFVLSPSAVSDDFLLRASDVSPRELIVQQSLISEIYPPLKLRYYTISNQLSSFISADVVPTATGSIQVDTSAQRLSGTKVLGPL